MWRELISGILVGNLNGYKFISKLLFKLINTPQGPSHPLTYYKTNTSRDGGGKYNSHAPIFAYIANAILYIKQIDG